MTTLVLLPGMDGTGSLFESFVARLPDGIDAKVVSYPVDEKLGYDALVERVLREVAHDKPFALLGESFSGPVAVAVAARSTPVALILACSFVTNPRPALAPLLAWLPGPGRWLDPFASFALLGRHATPELRWALSRAMRAVTPEVLRHRAVSVQGVDAGPALASVRCPVLYLRASEDRVVAPTCADEVLRIRPDATVALLEGPHALLQAKPAGAADAVAMFLRRVKGDSPVVPHSSSGAPSS